MRPADAYVIVVAWRFGHVPGRTASPSDGRSITEIELTEAKACGKPVLAFMLDPDAPWPPNRDDAMSGATGAGEDVSRLRSQLSTEYLAGIFRTPDDLAAKWPPQFLPGIDPPHDRPGARGDFCRQPRYGHVCPRDGGGYGFDAGQYQADDPTVRFSTCVGIAEIDDGQRWWSTRLFLLASLLQVAYGNPAGGFLRFSRTFAGMASPGAIIDGLSATFPELDEFARILRKSRLRLTSSGRQAVRRTCGMLM
jgi:hypothetical protein